MDSLPRELCHLIYDYLESRDFDEIEQYQYSKILLDKYDKVYFTFRLIGNDGNNYTKCQNFKKLRELKIYPLPEDKVKPILESSNFKYLQKLILLGRYRELNLMTHGFKNLTYLDCHGCGISHIPKELIRLTYLDISGCEDLTEIPETLINLTYLDCSRCRFYDMRRQYDSGIKKIPKTLENLTTLIIVNTNIKQIPKTLVNLTHLEFSGSYCIEDIPETLINLTYLDCFYSNIDNIPKTLINLMELYCNDSKVREMPDTLVKLEIFECKECCHIGELPKTLVNLRRWFCEGHAQSVD